MVGGASGGLPDLELPGDLSRGRLAAARDALSVPALEFVVDELERVDHGVAVVCFEPGLGVEQGGPTPGVQEREAGCQVGGTHNQCTLSRRLQAATAD